MHFLVLPLFSLVTYRSSILAHMHARTDARTHAVSSACAACEPASLSHYTLFITSPLHPPRQLRGTSSSRSFQALLLLLTSEKAALPPLRHSLFTCTAWQPAARLDYRRTALHCRPLRDDCLTFFSFCFSSFSLKLKGKTFWG